MNQKEEQHIFPDYGGLFEYVSEKYGENYTFEDIDNAVREKEYKGNEWMYDTFAFYILETVTADFYRYEDPTAFKDDPLIQTLKYYADAQDSSYYRAVLAFYNGEYKQCIDQLKKHIKEGDKSDEPYDELVIAEDYLAVFKNGFQGFWDELAAIFKEVNSVPYMNDLLNAIKLFYESDDSDEVKDALITVGRNIPDGYLVNEMLGICYAQDKMWKNAAAYYAAVPERAVLYYDTLYFNTAYAASKCRDLDRAIKYYEFCLEINKYYPYAMNNYGYELIRDKRLDDAKKIFEELLSDEELQKANGLSYIVNNYARVLLLLKLFDEAKDFANNSPRKIAKDILQRIERCDNTTDDRDDTAENEEQGPRKKGGKKQSQFSTEKLLEDELEARLIHGDDVFGPKLKIYDHEDDLYGRQYVIPVGRLDLLCEDSEGNYWIIELKKDSGYDDAFAQTMEYIRWFEENKAKDNGKKVYGIICLNGPDEELVEKVRKEPRIKLFEYTISYNEIV